MKLYWQWGGCLADGIYYKQYYQYNHMGTGGIICDQTTLKQLKKQVEYQISQNSLPPQNTSSLLHPNSPKYPKVIDNPQTYHPTDQKQPVHQYQLKAQCKGYIFLSTPTYSTQLSNLSGFVKVYNQHNNQMVFQGQYLRSKRNGYGIQYDSNEQVAYEGYFLEDTYNGWGNIQLSNIKYEGQFKDGLFDGFGMLQSDKQLYEGYYRRGNFDGFGIYFKGQSLKLPNNKALNELFIDFMNNEMKNLQEYNIDGIYIGEWKDGKKNGNGKQWFKDGSWYSGQFAHNLYHGVGALYKHHEGTNNPVVKTVFKNGHISKK